MSEMKHTPEPWSVSSHDKSIIKCYQGEQTPHGTTPYFAGGGALESERNANARRIVACVNACKGVDITWIESMAKVGGFSAMNHYIAAYNQAAESINVKKQRDELLSALERAVQSIIMFRNEQTLHRLLKLRTNVSYMEMHNAMDEARAAIARAKGGAA